MSITRTVFLSSTSKDLVEHRQRCYDAIESLDGYHCVRMENFGSRNWDADEFCRRRVAECDLILLLLGPCYGSCPPGSELSFTEREYQTAIESGRDYLVFASSALFPLPVQLIETDALRQRQQAFRARLESRVIAPFIAPQELARLVVTAISNWSEESSLRGRTNQQDAVVPEGVLESSADIGPYVTKLCDRSAQAGRFVRSAYFHHFTRPQTKWVPPPTLVYAVTGSEPEAHDSLFDRFRFCELPELAERVRGDGKGVVSSKDIRWPEAGNLEERKWNLMYELFRRFDGLDFFRGLESTAEDFAKIPNFGRSAFVLVHHRVNASTWNYTDTELVSFSSRFWSAVPTVEHGPSFIVLVSIVYPAWKSRINLPGLRILVRAWLRQRVHRALRKLCDPDIPHTDPNARCRTLELQPLRSVTSLQVQTWMREHRYFRFDEHRRVAAEKMFRNPRGRLLVTRTMSEIEPQLENIRLQFAKRRTQ